LTEPAPVPADGGFAFSSIPDCAMTLNLSPPPCTHSPLSRLDPRWKLASLMLAGLAVVFVQSLPPALIALAGSVVLALLGRLPGRWSRERLEAALAFVALFALPLPFLLWADEPSWSVGPVAISPYGTRVALLILCKAATLILLTLVGLVTAPLDANLKAARSLRVPGLLVHLVLLTYRYLFVLGDELARLRIALRVRGYRNRPSVHCYRTIGHVAGTLLVRGCERAERVSQAMRCRGFDGQFRSLVAFRTTAADVLAFAIVVAVSVGVLVLDRLTG
jgi:cobalt/nickel transport system permease protein